MRVCSRAPATRCGGAVNWPGSAEKSLAFAGQGNTGCKGRRPGEAHPPAPFLPLAPSDRACGNLPSDRRPPREHFPAARDGSSGRIHFRDVRHRRRLPDDAIAHLHRGVARGRGGDGIDPYRRLVDVRRRVLLAPPRHRPRARPDAAGRRHRRHPGRGVAVHLVAQDRPARHHHRYCLRAAAHLGRRHDGGGRRPRDAAAAPGQAGAAAPFRQPHLDPRPAAEDAVQAVPHLRVRGAGGRDRMDHGFRRRDPRHRRRLPPGADADLSPPGADQRGHRHLDGPHARHHGVGDGAPCDDQPPRRCGARADPHGGRGRRRPVRRPRRPEDAQRAPAAAARRARRSRSGCASPSTSWSGPRTSFPSARSRASNEVRRRRVGCHADCSADGRARRRRPGPGRTPDRLAVEPPCADHLDLHRRRARPVRDHGARARSRGRARAPTTSSPPSPGRGRPW